MGTVAPHLCENCGKPDPLELPFCGYCGHPNGSGGSGVVPPPVVAPPVAAAPVDAGGVAHVSPPFQDNGVAGAVHDPPPVTAAPPSADLELDPDQWADILATPGPIQAPASDQVASFVSTPPYAPPAVPASTSGLPRRGWVLIAAIIVLIAAAVGVVVASGGGGKHPTTTATTTASNRTPPPANHAPSASQGAVAGTSAAPWTSETYPASIAGGHLFTIACGSPTACWAVGNNGTGADIIATTNGGQSWSSQTVPADTGLSAGGHLFSISCATATTCQAVGSGTSLVILGTSNGGATWTSESFPPDLTGGHLFSVYCVSATDCWALGGAPAVASVILATTNGGATWVEQPYPSGLNLPDNGFLSISCPTLTRCYVIATSSNKLVLLTTGNGGASWQLQRVPSNIAARSNGIGSITCPTTSFCAITGYSDGASSSEAPLILVTRNGGRTMSTLQYPPSLGLASLTGVACAGTMACWTVGSTATTSVILSTTDGGSTWSAQSLPSGLQLGPHDFDSLYCANQSTCYILGINSVGKQIILASRS